MALAVFNNYMVIASILYIDKVNAFPYIILDDIGAI